MHYLCASLRIPDVVFLRVLRAASDLTPRRCSRHALFELNLVFNLASCIKELIAQCLVSDLRVRAYQGIHEGRISTRIISEVLGLGMTETGTFTCNVFWIKAWKDVPECLCSCSVKSLSPAITCDPAHAHPQQQAEQALWVYASISTAGPQASRLAQKGGLEYRFHRAPLRRERTSPCSISELESVIQQARCGFQSDDCLSGRAERVNVTRPVACGFCTRWRVISRMSSCGLSH